MAKKKTKAASRRMRRWLSTGAVTCSFIGFLVYISNLPQPAINEGVNVFNRSSVEAHVKATPTTEIAHYTFYKELPELKVMVRDVAENLPARINPVADRPVTDKSVADKIVIHTAAHADAFHSLAEADHRRAELLLMGRSARIEKTQANGSTEYRVLVGPFARRDAAQTQAWLAAK